MEFAMKALILASALAVVTSGAAFAQAGTVQGDSINPHPSRSVSSNDASRNPSAFVRGSESQATTGQATTSHKKKHKAKSGM
jgi:hypothetical protein